MRVSTSSVLLSFASPDGRETCNMPLDDLPHSGVPVDEHGEDFDFDTAYVTHDSGDRRTVGSDRIMLDFTHPDTGGAVSVPLSDVLAAGEPVDDRNRSYDMEYTVHVDLSGAEYAI